MEYSHTTDEAAHLRHALRTPLNHIIGYSEIIAEEIRDSVLPSDSAWALPLLDAIVSNAKELPVSTSECNFVASSSGLVYDACT
jgi:signal transduction histidine kinase